MERTRIVMLKKMAFLFLLSVLVGGLTFAYAEATDLFPDLEIIEEMDYVVGPELEPGEYILFARPNRTGFFHLATDVYDTDIIAEETFETNVIVTVAQDEYLILTDCVGVRAEDYYAGRKISGGLNGVMLKAGYDLEPGQYTLAPAPGKAGICRILLSSRHRTEDLLKESAVEAATVIEIGEGQYVQLIDCHIADGETRSPFDQPTPGNIGGETNFQAAVVIEADINPVVRDAPSTEGRILGEAKAGMTYELLDTDLRWYKIRLENGVEGWIVRYYAETIE